MYGAPPRSPPFPSTPLSRSDDQAELRLAGFQPPSLGADLHHRDRAGVVDVDRRLCEPVAGCGQAGPVDRLAKAPDRKSTRLNSSHGYNSYAVFCLNKKKKVT